MAFETEGAVAPWEVDFRLPTAVLIGGETTGIPRPLLASADALVRIPARGIIPSYNVQVAVSMALGEWLRQERAGG